MIFCDNAQRYDCASGADVAVSRSGLTRDNRVRVTGPADCSVALLLCMLYCSVSTEQSAGTNESPWYIERILSLDRSLVLNSCIEVSDYNEPYSLCQPLLP